MLEFSWILGKNPFIASQFILTRGTGSGFREIISFRRASPISKIYSIMMFKKTHLGLHKPDVTLFFILDWFIVLKAKDRLWNEVKKEGRYTSTRPRSLIAYVTSSILRPSRLKCFAYFMEFLFSKKEGYYACRNCSKAFGYWYNEKI